MLRLAQSLVLVASFGLTYVTATPAQAAPAFAPPTFTVNSLKDGLDAVPGDGKCATAERTCTLRAAIMEANASDGAKIVLGPGVHELSILGIDEDKALKGDLDILKPTQIVGVGRETVVDAKKIDRAFDVYVGNGLLEQNYAVTMSKFTIRNGRSDGMWLADQKGGAIRNRGTLHVSEMLMERNSNKDAEENRGGAILNAANGRLLLESSILTDNVGYGALANWGVALVQRTIIKRTNLQPSNVDLHGGGVHNTGRLTMIDSTISENRGGGIDSGVFIQAGGPDTELVLERVTIADNTEGADSGGLTVVKQLTKLSNVTISNNSAQSKGGSPKPGGIRANQGELTALNVTITGNKGSDGGPGGLLVESGASVKFANSILANNAPVDCTGTLTNIAPNLVESPAGCTGAMNPGNVTGIDPKLGPLQDNGGLTRTHALLAGSPAIDKGTNVLCLNKDQREKPRPANGDGVGAALCDLGAFEVQ